MPYPAAKEFKVPIRSRAFVTVVNLNNQDNDVKVDFSQLRMPYKAKMDPYESVTLEFSEDAYYYMDMTLSDTGFKQDPMWTFNDPDRRYALDDIPRIAVDRSDRELIFLSEENITKGSTLTVTASDQVLVFINYNRDQVYYPHGTDLIPGLTPPTFRGLPELPTILVVAGGMIVIADTIMIALGRKSIVEFF
jgi:hypothetical protein